MLSRQNTVSTSHRRLYEVYFVAPVVEPDRSDSGDRALRVLGTLSLRLVVPSPYATCIGLLMVAGLP